ncbi:ankyrin 2,3/unc44 [Metarhizium album ARSEF 1941]|uniref:Ankyrin 2,3/unc44 n=1 Tax=Metarhizium album (strain ARSEF 1941) TaxID=1081103 RepID=A0A0B2WYG7_METAS|nr:ankyrin 2,3/unc44 [Metarhizium album ARSEF 1941]KHO01297.1 ankyrin 2,3/unc44 [Metarhizium album ARSEF 1941]
MRWRWLQLHAASPAVLFASRVRADSDDDFANNLFSDLGPVLALFGEKVTMQFMSEAMGRADSIILAMAPIGILTIVVSAIRLAGPLWLKAVIGRARESVSAAEMELMSSASEEVCELYNGQSIVRCQGKPKIWEFMFLFKKRAAGERPNEPPDVEFKTLEQARGRDIVDGTGRLTTAPFQPGARSRKADVQADMTGWRSFWRKILFPCRRRKEPVHQDWKGRDSETACCADSSDDAVTPPQWDVKVIRDITTSAPNITLNGHDQISRLQVHGAAVFATLLQAGLVIFFGITTYHPDFKQRYLKEQKPVEASAFPLVASGTALLVLGLFICGHVNEASTEEYRYRPWDEDEMAQIMWIQRGQTVGDQVFKPYATLPRSKRTIITTSRRKLGQSPTETSAASHDDTEAPCDDGTARSGSYEAISSHGHAENVASTSDESRQSSVSQRMDRVRSWIDGHTDEVETVTGAGVSVLGFVVQFVGLRKMNWTASVAQLGAVLIMVGVRAWIRRGMSHPLAHRELAPDTELEWLALVLSGINNDADACFDLLKPKTSWRRTEAHGEMHAMSWTIDTDMDKSFRPLVATDDQAVVEGGSWAKSVLKIHQGLGRLANHRGQYVDLAIRLANCMEAAMNLFLACQFKAQADLTWYVRAQGRFGEAPQWIPFHLKRAGGSSQWRVAADELASALSLWIYSSRGCARNNGTLDARNDFSHLNKSDDSWLRDTAPESALGLRAFGRGNAIPKKQLIQDLMWWVPDDLGEIFEIREVAVATGGREEQTSTLRVESSQVVHSAGIRAQGGAGCHCCERFREFQHDEVNLEEQRWRTQAMLAETPEEAESESDAPWARFHDARHNQAEDAAGDGPTVLAIETHDEMGVLYAKALLCLFLRSVAKTLTSSSVGTAEARTVSSSRPGMQSPLVLRHEGIAELASEIQQNGLGLSLEAHVSIVWPLSLEEKLPFPDPVFDLALARSNELWRTKGLQAARLPYLWLWQQCRHFCESERSIYARAVACLMEHLKDSHDEREISILTKEQKRSVGEAHGVLTSLLEAESKRHEVVSQLSLLYGDGRHPWPQSLERIAPAVSGETAPGLVWTKPLCFTPVHRKAIDHPKIWNYALEIAGYIFHITDATAWTPLHYMVLGGGPGGDIDEYQDEENMSWIHQTDLRGWKILHYACWCGTYSAVAYLVKAGASIARRGIDGASPFHCAARNEEAEVLQFLLDSQNRNDEADGPSEPGLSHVPTPRHSKGRPQSLPDHEGRAPIHWAVLADKQDAVEKLLDDKEARDNKGRRPLHTAALCRRLGITKTLVGACADIEALDDLGRTPLHSAAVGGEAELVKFLLEAGANTDATDASNKTPLDLASRMEIATLLSDAGADAEEMTGSSKTLLHRAAENGDVEQVVFLLDTGANVEATDGQKKTALHLATEAGERETVEMLLQAGASTEAMDSLKKTPLHLAIESARPEIVKLLLVAGADIEARDRWKNTFLHTAVEGGNPEIVGLLLKTGANIKARRVGGRTPLHVAAAAGKPEVVRMLLEAGADMEAVDGDGDTAFVVANQVGKEETAQLLWRAGARASGWARGNGRREAAELA